MKPAPLPLEISIDPSKAADTIGDDFVGLSYETEQVLPNAKGTHYFSPDNKPLITLFKTIGVKNLRIGGNSVDRIVTGIPGPADIDQLFAFARAVGAKVIYSVRLQDGEAQSAADIVKHIYDHHADLLDCFAIGNEPAYYKPYDNFRGKWRTIMEAIIAVVPQATFCGPDTNPDPAWCKSMVDEFGKSGPMSMLTVHNYPGDCSYKNPGAKKVEDLVPKDAAVAREQMLSSAWYAIYAKVQKGMADAVAGTPLPFRLAETNNFWYGGLKGASDSYASALWSADYLYWYASHGAKGLNFHTGDRVGGGETTLTSRYTAFVTTGNGYEIRPLSYGMKLFDLGGHGKLIPLTLSSEAGDGVSAYATLSANQLLTVTLINKTHAAGAKEAAITLKLKSPSKPSSARTISMTEADGNVEANFGITIGGQPIQSDGSWTGQWKPLNISGAGDIAVNVAPASATVVSVQL